MKVSVVIPTYNRAGQITNLLTALEDQTYHDFETIIVNDGSTDGTLEVLSEFTSHTALKMKVYSIANQGRAGSRNYGIKQASGDLIICFDDDTRPNPEAVLNHYQCHLRHVNALVSGPYLYDHSKFKNDFNYFRQWMELKWTSRKENIVESENLKINGGNFSIRKADFLLAGGFDERLKDKEDFKLSFDFKYRCNGNVLYSYHTWVFHDDFKGLVDYIERERASRLEEQKLPQVAPEIGILFPERFMIKLPKGLLYQAGRIFRVRLLIILCEKLLNRKLIFRRLRYKLYDIVITMNVRYF